MVERKMNIEIPELLPKNWKPKGEYTEMCRGIGIEYEEKIVRKCDVATEIMAGWSISRLSKLSPSMVHGKWAYAIDAMDKEYENNSKSGVQT